jgi:ADP-ribosyl-[dinitrogen reductase] hydrolase
VSDGSSLKLAEPSVLELAAGRYLKKSRNEVRGSGYAVASLEAALWCFHSTLTYEAAVLEAANLGEDADTTAAIVGQIAGAFYGVQGIPATWLQKLHMRDEIMAMAERLYDTTVG